MKFGVFFDLQMPRPWADGDEAKLLEEALAQAECADRCGIDYLWAQEHHFLEEYSHSSAPEVFLAAASQRTKRIRLGHGIAVMPPKFNHPARVAERIATLDLLSGGRVEWGSGESSSHVELGGFGVDYVEKRMMWAEATREAARMMTSSPYPGYEGKYFSMPPRNVVPKPAQRPHPPMWLACSNRETLRLAARLGLGALTFAFMNRDEARFWVEEYYEVFSSECTPIGKTVNPNVAMLTGFMCDGDGERARSIGLEGLRFFAYGLSHYFRTGVHTPGETDVWRAFTEAPVGPVAGSGGFGTPDEVAEAFETFEQVGVDQLILLQQCGRYSHQDIMRSLELFGEEVLPGFHDRHVERAERKRNELQPYVERALQRVSPETAASGGVPIEAYPLIMDRATATSEEIGPNRTLDAASLWRLHVGGGATDE